METVYKGNRRIRIIGLGRFFIAILIVFIGATAAVQLSKPLIPFASHSDLQQLDNSIQNVAGMSDIDQQRNSNIEKIISIADRYNKEMSADLKRDIAAEIHEMSIKYTNLDVDLICATITHESAKTWRPTVVSQAGAMGLMQIMPATGAFLAQEEGVHWTTPQEVLFNPIINIRLGCRYLSSLVATYEVDGGLAAYNGGARRAAMWISNGKDNSILWKETRGYIPAIMNLYAKYRNEVNTL